MHNGQGIPGQEDIERKGTIERLSPRPNSTGNHAAHRQGTDKTIRIELNQSSGDDATERVAPGKRAGGMTAGRIEEIQQCDLIVEGLLNCPAILTIGRASKRIA